MSVQLVVDMNLSVEWIAALVAQGWSAAHWSTVGDPRAEDSAIMAWARANAHVVFTHDLDFGTILALTHATGPSVLQVRGQNVLPEYMGGPDAPFGRHGRFLIEGPSHARAIRALDAFLRAKDDQRVKDPLKRALLQRDLWYVFDKLAEPTLLDSESDPAKEKKTQRRSLQKRLAQVMRRLEQPAGRLRALPDNYALVIKRGTFPTKFDPNKPKQPYLPADLHLDGTGDWVPVSRWYSASTGLAAPAHARFAAGKAVFLTLLRLPRGRLETEAFVARLLPGRHKTFPQFPDGTQVALVRRLLLVDDQGTLQATPVTENVQLRVFPKGDEQRVFELTLDRPGLLSSHGGLRAVGPTDAEYFGFGANHNQIDAFISEPFPRPRLILSSCMHCHDGTKLFSISTFGFGFQEGYRGAARTTFAAQVRHTAGLKKTSYAWGLLQGLRETTAP